MSIIPAEDIIDLSNPWEDEDDTLYPSVRSIKTKSSTLPGVLSGVTMMQPSPAGVTIKSASPQVILNSLDNGSVVMEAHDDPSPFIEVFVSPEAIPTQGQIGALVFAKGIAYIRTREGIVNLGEALGRAEPIFLTPEQEMDKQNDRRAAIKAQKAKKNAR